MEDLGIFLLYFAGMGVVFSSVALLSAIIVGKQAEESLRGEE